MAALPLFTIERIGDAPAQALPAGDRPLAGVKVLDLTRVIAGPVCGRTLAAHGADVLLVTGRASAGDRAAGDRHRPRQAVGALDLREPRRARRSPALLRDADIFVQGYRPGAIARYGFGPQDAARLRPGIVYVSLCAYGHEGPWAGRRGFDSLVQNANGLNVAEAEAAGADEPKPLPARTSITRTGYLMAFGAMTALRAPRDRGRQLACARARSRRPASGSASSAASTACRLPRSRVRRRARPAGEAPSGFGRLTAVRHAAVMSETPPRWDRPSVPLGTHPPAWPD